MSTVPKNNRFAAWVKRHKIVSVFLGLVAALAVYMGIWQVVFDWQGRLERDRFRDMLVLFEGVNAKLKSEGLTVDSLTAGCDHASFGTIFEQPRISCEVEINLPVEGNAVSASEIQPLINKGLDSYGIGMRQVHDALPGSSQYYDFSYKNFDCFEAFQLKSVTDPQPLLSIGCDGSARQDYYPKNT